MSDRTLLTGLQVGLSAPLSLATPAERSTSAVHKAEQRLFSCWVLLAAEAAAATTTDQAFAYFERPVQLVSARYLPQAALTANDTNFATVAVAWNNDAGGALTTLASQTTKITGGSGNWTANQSVNLPLAANPQSTAATFALHFTTTKTGTGVIVPAGLIFLVWEEI